MTKKDYIRIAKALRSMTGRSEGFINFTPRLIYALAERLAFELASDSPRFNREHFLAVVRGERALESRPPRKGKGEKR